MIIPIGIWQVVIVLAVLTTAIAIFTRDRNNYTDAIAGVLAILLWFVTGLSCLIGIQSDSIVFTGVYMFWIFLIVGIIVGVITFVKILDIINSRKNERHTHFDPVGL